MEIQISTIRTGATNVGNADVDELRELTKQIKGLTTVLRNDMGARAVIKVEAGALGIVIALCAAMMCAFCLVAGAVFANWSMHQHSRMENKTIELDAWRGELERRTLKLDQRVTTVENKSK